MKKLIDFVEKFLDYLLGGFIFLMFLFVLSNVILRYFFNSGLTWAEELSRFLFVWVSFIGAIGALKASKHLGFTTLIKKCPGPLKMFFYLLSNALMLVLLYMVFVGSWKMTIQGMTNLAPTTQLPFSVVWIVGVISSFFMAVIILTKSVRAIFVPGALDKLVDMTDSEDADTLEKFEKQQLERGEK